MSKFSLIEVDPHDLKPGDEFIDIYTSKGSVYRGIVERESGLPGYNEYVAYDEDAEVLIRPERLFFKIQRFEDEA